MDANHEIGQFEPNFNLIIQVESIKTKNLQFTAIIYSFRVLRQNKFPKIKLTTDHLLLAQFQL